MSLKQAITYIFFMLVIISASYLVYVFSSQSISMPKSQENPSIIFVDKDKSIELGVRLSLLPSDSDLNRYYHKYLDDNLRLPKENYDFILNKLEERQEKLKEQLSLIEQEKANLKKLSPKEAALEDLKAFDEIGEMVVSNPLDRARVREELIKNVNNTK